MSCPGQRERDGERYLEMLTLKLKMVAYTCNPRTLEAEAGGLPRI